MMRDMSARIRYPHTYRRALLDMHIPDWDPEFLARYDPVRVAEQYRQAGVTGALVYCKSHLGLSYWPTPVGPIHPAARNRDLVDELTCALRERGIAVGAYHSVICDNAAVEARPEWAVVPAGEVDDPGAVITGHRYGTACPNNPGYREYEKTQIAALLSRYDFDTLFLDMTFWTGICACASCRDRLGREVGIELPATIDWADPDWVRFQQARERWLEEFLVELITTARATQPAIAVTHNLSPGTYGWLPAQKVDWSSLDHYAAGDIYGGRDEQLLVAKLMLHLGGQPAEFMTAVTPDLGSHAGVKTEHALLTEALGAVTHGAAIVFIDAIDPRGTVRSGLYQQLRRVLDIVAPLEPFLGGTPIEDVAIYYSDDSRINPDDNGRPVGRALTGKEALPHLRAATGAARLLQQRQIPFGAITRSSLPLLSRYRVVVLPDVLRMSDEEVEAFRVFVREGGRLYVSGRTSLLDPHGVEHEDFRLAEVFGCHVEGAEPGTITYLRPTTALVEAAIQPDEYLESPGSSRGMPRLRASTAGEVLGTLSLPYAYPSPGTAPDHAFASIHSSPPWDDLEAPVLVRNRVGRGRALYSTLPLELGASAAAARLFGALILDLLDERPTFSSDGSADLWLTAFDQPDHGRSVICALDYRTDVRPLAHPLAIRYRPPRDRHVFGVTGAVGGEAIPFRGLDDGSIEFLVERFELFGMYLVA
jgi:hypothetical protein